MPVRIAFIAASILSLASFAWAQQDNNDNDDVRDPTEPGTYGTGNEKALGKHANIVDLAISLASLVGCLIIIVPYMLNKHPRKLRHSLIVGLAVSDFASACV